MADGTEALKHNFLVRRFFLHRGYYDLTHISADKYRQDRLFTSPENYRVWLSGSETVSTESEWWRRTLRPGKKRYWRMPWRNTANRSYRVQSSLRGTRMLTAQRINSHCREARAIVVRQYLLNHFQLNSGNLGAVPLRNTSTQRIWPSGMGRNLHCGFETKALSPT